MYYSTAQRQVFESQSRKQALIEAAKRAGGFDLLALSEELPDAGGNTFANLGDQSASFTVQSGTGANTIANDSEAGRVFEITGSDTKLIESNWNKQTASGNQSISFGGWYKFNSLGQAWFWRQEFEIVLRLDSSSRPEMILNSFSSGDRVNSPDAVAIDTWYFIVATYLGSGNDLEIYVDAVQKATQTPSGSWAYSGSQNIMIGRSGSSVNADAKLDFQFFRFSGMTGGQIADLYNQTKKYFE